MISKKYKDCIQIFPGKDPVKITTEDGILYADGEKMEHVEVVNAWYFAKSAIKTFL